MNARDNARVWSETITALVAALEADYGRLAELREDRAELVGAVGRADLKSDKAMCLIALGDWDEENGEELKDLTEAVTVDGDIMENGDAVRERIRESPLSVMVRGDWYSPGQVHDNLTPVEFEILLSTGGPALRIMGELDGHCQPRRAWLQYQDWGTPWTDFVGESAGAPSQNDLLAFCGVFYFGE